MTLPDITQIGIALELVCSVYGLLAIGIGVLFGICVGAIPGMSPSMGVALLVPFSYTLDPQLAFLLFVATYQAANYGGSITAIALNTPGTPASVVTALDGYALTQKGKASHALKMAVFSSSIGGFFGTIILILFTVPVARFALAFGPAEYFALALLGLATVVGFGKGSTRRSVLAVLIGMLLGTVGVDPFSGAERFTFGIPELFEGITLVPVLIGLFALGEVFFQIWKPGQHLDSALDKHSTPPSFISFFSYWKTILRSSILGTGIGVVPGAGATIASFVSYGLARRKSHEPETFGTGSIDGIAASESANSSSVGGALIPLLALGIPGSATDAVLLGALTLHGLVAGPGLMQSDPELVYGIFISLLVANVLILFVGSLGNRLWLSIIRMPQEVTLVLVATMSVLGSYTVHGSLFDVLICLTTGILGYFCKRFGIPPAAIVLGLVLGPMIEMNLRRALLAETFTAIMLRPLAGTCILLTLISLLLPVFSSLRKKI